MSELNQETTGAVGQAIRKVTIYSTKTGSKQSIESKETTYGPLKREIRNLGIDVDKFLVTETGKKVTYELDEAELPTGPFYLIIRPKETKSGAKATAKAYPLDRKELMTAIKDAVHADPKLKEKLSGNVTQMKTPILEDFHKKHIAGKTFKAVPVKEAKKVVTKKETPVVKAKEKKVSTPAIEEKVKKTVATKEEIKPTKETSKNVTNVVDPVIKSKKQLEKEDKAETDMLAGMSKRLFKR